MNKDQHPNAAEALLNWTLTRADGRIVVQHASGSFYAATREGDSGIAESVLYMLADSLLSATLSPAHVEDEREAAIVQFAKTFPMTSESASGGNQYDIELRRYYLLGWDDRAALSAPPAAGVPEGWRLVPMEPTPEMWGAAGDAVVNLTGIGIHHDIVSRVVFDAMLAATPTPPASEQQRAVVMPERRDHPSMSMYAGFKEYATAYGEVSGHNACLDELLRLNPHLAKGEGDA